MNLDHELRRALNRKDPAPGFAEKVVARLPEPGGRMEASNAIRRRRWLAFPIAASLLAAFGWSYYAELQHQAEAERAAYEVMVALQIAGDKLSDVQRKVGELSAR